MDTMPERYETQQTTTVSHDNQATVHVGLNLPYLRSLPGILKLVESGLDLIVIICVAALPNWSLMPSGGFITFVGVIALVTTLLLFLFHFTNIIYKLPGPWVLIEFGYLIAVIVLYFIVAILAATAGGFGSMIAACVFGVAAMIVYAVEAAMCFRVWRGGSGFYVASRNTTAGTATSTSTTTTTVKTQETYAVS